MTPFRRGKAGRRPPPLGSKRPRETPPDEAAEDAESSSKQAPAAAQSSRQARAKQPKPDRESAKASARKAARKPPEAAEEPSKSAGRPARKRAKPPRRDAKPAAKRRRSRTLAQRATAGRSSIAKRSTAAGASLAKSVGPPLRKAGASAEKSARAALASLASGLRTIAALVLGGLQEIGSVWIRTAEISGGALLWVERALRPYLIAALRALRSALRFAQRVVTPRRTVAFVVVCAAVLLAASQFVDYRGVEIGAPAYAGVEAVAPPPQTDVQTTGSVHGYAMVPVAVIVIAAALLALRGRWRLARMIPLLGALAIAVSLLLDARKGLQEGEVGIAYQGAHAVLNEGFWLQLSSAAVLVVTGLLLTRYARPREAPAARRGRERKRPPRRRRRLRIAGVRA